jgi:mono/diheme cytochrome c family protein
LQRTDAEKWWPIIKEPRPQGGVTCGNPAQAQTDAPAAATNDLQRSFEIYNYNVAATSGAQRGEVIYYYKCWVCHNDYTIAAGSPAPTLKDVFKRAQLRTGEPVNDTTVANQIRNGSAQMPAFGSFLKDNDIADLLAYLRDKCCYQETNPPKNLWYRVETLGRVLPIRLVPGLDQGQSQSEQPNTTNPTRPWH